MSAGFEIKKADQVLLEWSNLSYFVPMKQPDEHILPDNTSDEAK